MHGSFLSSWFSCRINNSFKRLNINWKGKSVEHLFSCGTQGRVMLLLGSYKCYNSEFKPSWQHSWSHGTCVGIFSARCTAVWRASMPSKKMSWRRWDKTISSWSGSTTTWSRPVRSWGGCTMMTRERWLIWRCCTSRYLCNWQFALMLIHLEISKYCSSPPLATFWDAILWILKRWPLIPRGPRHSEKQGQTIGPPVSPSIKTCVQIKRMTQPVFWLCRQTCCIFCLIAVRRTDHYILAIPYITMRVSFIGYLVAGIDASLSPESVLSKVNYCKVKLGIKLAEWCQSKGKFKRDMMHNKTVGCSCDQHMDQENVRVFKLMNITSTVTSSWICSCLNCWDKSRTMFFTGWFKRQLAQQRKPAA